ncbi:uncharacterized protein ISCGN_031216 [Ixodes scapularis]
MFRVVLIGWLTLQQFPLGTSSAEVVLLSSAVPGAPSTPHHATVVKASVNAPDELKATVPAQYELVPAMGTVINVTFANGTFYGQYDIPEGADLNASLAAIANEADGLQADIVLLAKDSPLETTLKETSPPTTAPPATKTHPSTVERKDSATTSFEKMTTLSSAPEVGGSNMAVISVELGKLSIHPKPAIIENGRAVELFCSVGYSVSASIVWTLNDQPIEDVVLRSVISGRKEFLLKSNRIRVERLETLPAVEGKYVFECVASVDGVLLKEKVKLDSPYANSCSQDSDCRSRNAVCSPASKCVCDDAHPVKLNSSHVTCRTAAHLGWPCNYHEQCLHAANRSQCGSHGECSCVEMYRLDKFAEEPHTYGIDKQFMWGSSLLISPILEENQTYMSFYVPRGLWYNYYTNAPFPSTGEYMILDDVTLSTKTPLYVRAGSVIPTQKPGMSTRDSLKKPFTLLVYPEEGSATGQLFWDDGVSKRTVERNRYDYFVFHVKRCRLTISKTHTNVEPLLVTLEKIVVMSAFVPTRLYVDGKKRKEAIGKMSDEAFKLTVQLELHDLRRVHVIEWTTESQNGTECPK